MTHGTSVGLLAATGVSGETMCHASVRMRTTTRASHVGFVTFALLCAGAAAQSPPSSLTVDASASWPDLLALDLTTCAEQRCASVDDRACASTCDASRTAPPVCREVDCAQCLDGASECEGERCGERVCVLCAWPGEGDDVSHVCHASTASPPSTAVAPGSARGDVVTAGLPLERAADAQAGARPSWALYEVKDHRYRLLTSGFLGGPLRPAKTVSASPAPSNGVRERIGKMGMLALIHASRERGDDPVAHVFSAGGVFADSVHASFESPSVARDGGAVLHTSFDSGPAVHDVRAVLLERTLPPTTRDKRASAVTARLGGDFLIDIDGSMDDVRAKRTLLRHKDAFQLCYENAFKLDAAPSGKLAVEFDVDANGRVVDVYLAEDELDSDALSTCVLSTVGRLRFPASAGDGMSFDAILSFRRKT